MMETTNETWRRVDFNHNYEVSDLGRVRSAVTRRGSAAGKILKPRPSGDGYSKVVIHTNGVARQVGIHRLVATAFLGLPPTPRHEVNHKNSNGEDNRLSNLEWVSHQDNMRHAYAVGRIRIPTVGGGERVGTSKLKAAQVLEIKRRLAAGERATDIAANYGVTRGTIHHIRRGDRWRCMQFS